MQWKRLTYYLLINVVVSATTTIVVLNIWERNHQAALERTTPVAVLPTAAPTKSPQTPTPRPSPTLAAQPHEVRSGETLGQIADNYDTTVKAILAINDLADPNSLEIGQIIYIPLPDDISATEAPTAQATEEPVITLALTEVESEAQETGGQVEIVTVVGVGDLATEKLFLGDLEGEKHSLAGWQLQDEDGHSYTFPKATLYENGQIIVNTGTGHDSSLDLFWGLTEPVWEPGEIATLLDTAGNAQATYQIP
ncbi:MAG: LysM peptidoglycan-binding domain-containing protein [Chloroflexota bacterium]|nr:LysM peptidoglycan-binding domain-containing protein [Chloroflexota bacterium]